MKTFLTAPLTLVVALSATPVLAEQKMMEAMPMEEMKEMPAAGLAVHTARGKVTRVDAAAGAVTLAHGPVESLGWPAMTMGFKVKDQTLFDRLAVGNDVEFEFQQGEKGYVVTGVK